MDTEADRWPLARFSHEQQAAVCAGGERRIFKGPNYRQDAWVAAHGYADQPWETLLGWWEAEHEILMAVVDRISESRFDAPCVMDEDAPVSLRFLIEDYVEHQRWHLKQLLAPRL